MMKTRNTIFATILSVLACFALLPRAQAVSPAPDGFYPGFNTAEGQSALLNLDVTNGFANTAVGWSSLLSNIDGDFNTATGAGALLFNTVDGNTAFGAAALLFNTTGGLNTAVGAAALLNNNGPENTAIGYQALNQNTTANDNTAVGLFALLSNIDGTSNTAVGAAALRFNTSGSDNQAFGRGALRNNPTGSNHIGIGREAGAGLTTVDNNIIIGRHSGVHSVFGQVSDRCFIDNIFGAPVSAGTAAIVLVDSDGRLGTFTVDGPDPGGFSSQPAQLYVPQGGKEAMLKVEKLQATVAQQQKQIEILTAQLNEQAVQIQKVSAQVEASKPAPQVVLNNP
jgi:hypothetical protein